MIHDAVDHMFAVWLDDPWIEHICEETADEVILMKDTSALWSNSSSFIIGPSWAHCGVRRHFCACWTSTSHSAAKVGRERARSD